MRTTALRLSFFLVTLAFVGLLDCRPVAAEPLLDPHTQPKFVNPLPIPAQVDATNGGLFNVTISELQQHLGLYDHLSGEPLDENHPLTTLPTNLRPLHGPIPPLTHNGMIRNLLLFEGEDEYGRLRPQLGTTSDGALPWDDPITENPMLNNVEVWEVYNATQDAHPIHLHLVAFQILDRQKFKADIDAETAALSNIRKIGRAKDSQPGEKGWKDTVIMYPGEVTRIIARFDREGRYVWHCHILSHEDHEMMRPYVVGPMAISP